jgi:hypothetical protein
MRMRNKVNIDINSHYCRQAKMSLRDTGSHIKVVFEHRTVVDNCIIKGLTDDSPFNIFLANIKLVTVSTG